jgi:hypothetical protein
VDKMGMLSRSGGEALRDPLLHGEKSASPSPNLPQAPLVAL